MSYCVAQGHLLFLLHLVLLKGVVFVKVSSPGVFMRYCISHLVTFDDFFASKFISVILNSSRFQVMVH